MDDSYGLGIVVWTFLLLLLFGCIRLILDAIAMTKIFKKMGANPFAAWIPIWREWVLYDETLNSGWLAIFAYITGLKFIIDMIARWKMYAEFGFGVGWRIVFIIPGLDLIGDWICALNSNSWYSIYDTNVQIYDNGDYLDEKKETVENFQYSQKDFSNDF